MRYEIEPPRSGSSEFRDRDYRGARLEAKLIRRRERRKQAKRPRHPAEAKPFGWIDAAIVVPLLLILTGLIARC